MNYLQWLAQETETTWWHDSADIAEQQQARAWGAVGMTTNPFLINNALHSDSALWASRVLLDPAQCEGDEKVLDLMRAVTGYFAEVFAKEGYVCAQTNPNKCGDYVYMLEQAKIYASWSPNIVIKLPATKAGIRVYEECVALGIPVAATVSFTVPQVLAVAEAAERGKDRARKAGIPKALSIAVLMVGRLDDYLRDVAQDQESVVTETDIRQAGTACMKRAYKLFTERGYDTKLMPAGSRGAYHIQALSGASMIMSIAPKIQKELIAVKEPFKAQIDEPVSEDVIERLLTLREFQRAYEVGGMVEEEFITYGSCNRTIDQFINDGWNPLLSFDFKGVSL